MTEIREAISNAFALLRGIDTETPQMLSYTGRGRLCRGVSCGMIAMWRHGGATPQ
ncbi:hypothetical protein [Candidatus Magnetominusculus dajiuhuensis]|uniref:hypothetical protein n=1 Tax=Candidatus Magnetominusculus dajiuhuensis TaxID=3137712 RepID=UPI003B434B70